MSKKNVHRWNATTLPTRARWVFLSISLLVNFTLAQTDVTAAINTAPSFTLTVGYGQTNGTLVGAWGRNDGGQTNVPPDLTNVVAISAGYQHSLALRADGSVVAWGTNDLGQTDVPAGLSGVAAIAAGFSHNVVLLSNGTVIAWGGSNNYGETNVPSGLSNVVAIAAGAQRSAALLGDGTLRLWGLYEPALTNLTGVRAFSYGRAHGLALLENGTVVALGNNDYDQTNQPPNLTNVMAIAPGAYHNFVLHSNGTVTTWGDEIYALNGPPGGVDDIIAISACGFANLAIHNDGTLAVWGLLDSTMENQAPPAGSPPYLAVSGGGHHAVALFANLVRPVTVLKGSGPFSTNGAAIDISAGLGESAQTLNFVLTVADTNLFSFQPALSTNGTLTFTPAPNTYGTTTVSVVLMDNGGTGGGGDDTSDAQTFIIEIADANQPPTVSVPLSITALEDTLTAITNVVVADPDDTGAAMAVTFSVEQGYFRPNQGSGVTVNSGQRSESMTFTGTATALNNFIAAGNVQFTAARDEFGPATLTVLLNDLGHGDENLALTTTNTCTLDVLAVNDAPTFTLLYHNEDGLAPAGVNWIVDEGLLDPLPLSWTNLVALAGGLGHYIGLRTDGSVVGEEIGNEWSLGAGTIPDGLQDVSAIAAGWLHNVALKRDGTVVAWGWDVAGSTNVPPGLDSVRAISAGSAHTMALRSNGTVVAWGGYDTNLVQVPAGLTNVAAIAAGWTYPANNSGLECIALLSNEVVRVWFDHGNGLSNLSLSLPGVVGVTRSTDPGTVFALMSNSNAVVLDWTSGELVVSNRSEFSTRGLTNVVQITATDYSLAAMYHDGWIEGVNYLSGGLVAAPATLTNVLSLFAGPLYPMAIYQAQHQRLHLTEGAGAVSILVATNFSVGPTNETEPMAWLVTASDPSMFTEQPHFVSSLSGELEFTLAPNARGTNVLTVQLIDYGGTNYGGVDTSTQTFTLVIAGTEDAPAAVADSYDVTEDIIVVEPALTGVLANDTEVDGEELFASLVTDVSHGFFSLGTDGSFIYLPTVDFFGTDSFQYQATNNAGTSAVVTVTLTVNPENDSPIIVSSDTDAAAGVEQSLSGLFAMDVDSGSNIVSLSLSSAVAHFSAASTAEVTAVTNGLPAGSLRLYGAMTNLITFLNATLVRLEVPTGVTTNITYSVTVDDHGHIGADPGTTGTATNEIASATNVIVVLPAATYVHVPADGVYGLGAPLDFTVQTSEPVIVDTAGGTPTIRISLWSPTRTASYVSGSGTTNLVFRYTVLAGDYAGSAPTVFSIIEANGGTLRDADGNNMRLSLLSIASTAGISVDALEPEIAALIPPLAGTHPVNTSLYFGVLFDEVVVVETTNGFPRLALTIGNTNVWAEYNTNASVGDFLSFTYTVRDGDLATNGIIVGQTLDLNGSTIRDVAGNDAQLDFGSNMPLTTVRVDTVPPEFVYAIHYLHSLYFPIGSELHFVAYVSEPVTVDTTLGVPRVEYQLDSGAVYGTYVSNDFDGQHLHFLYTVQAGDYATNGVLRSTNLVFSGALIRDAAGNLAGPRTTGPYLLEGAIVDGFPPSPTNDVIWPTNGLYQAGQQLTVTMEFTEPVVFRGSATNAVTFQIGAAQHVITNATQARSNELTFAYTIQAGDFDPDGVTIATALQVEDLAGNTVTSNAFILFEGVLVDASAPIADADSFTLGEDSVLAGVSVLDNDTDADTNALTATLVSSTAHGALDFNPDGSFTYTPATNFAGSDGFTYSITDGVLTSAVATVALTIVATNDPPTITGPLGLIVTNGVALPLAGVSVADVDSDTNLIELVLVSGDLGSVFIATNRSGVTVSNDNGVFTHLWGSVSNLNAYLAATNVSYVADTNRVTHSAVQVLISDHGYTGADPGLDSNPAGESALLQISIENGGINNPPVIGVGLTNQTGTYGSFFSYTFVTNAFLEPDSQTLRYLASGLPGGITFTDATRTFAGTPATAGSYTVRVIAGDGQSPELFATNSFTFTVGKASLVVTADDKTRACGAPNPAFTIRYTGLIGSDTAGGIDTPPAARTAATTVSPPGTFPISLTGGSDDSYTFTFVDGTLTITNGAGGTLQGVYHGLLHQTNDVRHESSGAIQVKTTDAGKYSGVLELAGRKLRLSGVFDGQRRATNRIERTGLAPLVVELILDACEPPQALLGNVTDGSWRAEIYGASLRYHARTNPAPMAGRYTMVLPGADGDSTLPHGDGYGVITIATSGKLKFTGALGDGTKISDGSVINAAELWPLYVPLYKGQGSTLGWLLFSNAPSSDLSGLVSWIRPAQSLGTYYGAGFTNETTAVGLRYLAPAKGSNILAWTNGIAIATGGNRSGGGSNVFTIGPSHRVTVQGTNISNIVLSAKDGRFKGTLRNPASSKATTFNGVLLQGLDQGFGFFLGTNQSGRIVIEPAAETD